jgi:hypothetical protein
MTAKAPTPKEIRQARAFLQGRNIRTKDIAPLDFLMASREIGKSFIETLRLISSLLTEDQGQGQAVEATKAMKR